MIMKSWVMWWVLIRFIHSPQSQSCTTINDAPIREAAKKVPPLMAKPLRPYPPLELNGYLNFFYSTKKYFFLNGPAYTSINGLAIGGGTFFAASLIYDWTTFLISLVEFFVSAYFAMLLYFLRKITHKKNQYNTS